MDAMDAVADFITVEVLRGIEAAGYRVVPADKWDELNRMRSATRI